MAAMFQYLLAFIHNHYLIALIAAIVAFALVVGLIIWFYRNFKIKEIVIEKAGVSVKAERQAEDASIPAAPDNKPVPSATAQVILYSQSPGDFTVTVPPPTAAACAPGRSHVTKFVDRGEIMNELRAALREGKKTAVVGVGGMGGVGKTELARHLFCELDEEKPGYPLWITAADRPLAAIHQEMARALGVIFPPTADDEAKAGILRGAFYEKPRAVFLDDVRRSLMPVLHLCLPPINCPALITSRFTEFPQLPAGAIKHLGVMTKEQSDELLNNVPDLAVALRQEPDAAARLAKVCCYHPLALNLAARRLRMALNYPEPIAAFVRNLKDRMTQLKVGEGPLGSLEANFEISYSDLAPDDQARFRKLSVFAPSGFSPSAATAIWDDDAITAEAALFRMQSYSLIQQAAEPGRFRLHDLIRDYSKAKLIKSGELEQEYRKNAQYWITLFEQHKCDNLSNAPDLIYELDNLLEAANQSMEQKATEDLARLATVPRNWMLVIFCVWKEWERWLDATINMGLEEKGLKADVFMAKGDINSFRGNYDEAIDNFSKTLRIYKKLDDRSGQANMILSIADVQRLRSENEAAMKNCKVALELFREEKDHLGRANVLKCMGDIKRSEAQYDSAMQCYQAAIQIYQEEKDLLGEAHVLCGQSRVMLFRHEVKQAKELFEHAIRIYKDIGDRYSMAAQLANFGFTMMGLYVGGRGSNYLSRAAQLFDDIGLHDRARELRKAMSDY